MNKLKQFLAIALVAVLSGCLPAPSVHPLWSYDTITFEPKLLGTWKDTEGDLWVFEQTGESAYWLRAPEEGAASPTYEVHLVRLGERVFLDMVPDAPEADNYTYLLPLHTFHRIWIEGDRVRLARLDDELLGQAIEAGTVRAEHTMVNDGGGTGPLLTATTDKLQKLVQDHYEELFDESDGITLCRLDDEGKEVTPCVTS